MCKKLMFLISFVALLGLVNVASADDIVWIGTGSFCDPANWDGGVVPGPDDEAIVDCDNGGGTCVIDCDVEVDRMHGPAYEADCNQTMDIVSGTIIAHDRWRSIMEGDKTGWVNMTGGDITVHGEMRVNDDAAVAAYWNMSGGSLTVYHRVRSGDSGGNNNQTHWSFSGDAVVNTDRYFRIGDDGGGTFTAGGNASLNIGHDENEDGDLYFVCRNQSVSVDISGNCEIWAREDFRLGNPGQAARDNPVTCNMTMSGGTLSANRQRLGWDPDKPDDFSCTVDMTGGLLIARSDLQVGPKTTVNLAGGEIQVLDESSLEIADGGVIDITDGALVLAGNKIAEISALVCDAIPAKITGYGAPAGVVMDYGVTNPGKTTVTGMVSDPDKAYCPSPGNGADKVQSVISIVELCWNPGASLGGRGRQGLYFADDCQAVTDANSNPNVWPGLGYLRADELCYVIGNLPLWTTYCWRVDSHNEDGSYAKGLTWSFTTGCELIPGDTNLDCLVNFEDYACVAGTWMEEQLWPE
jgi:hypothetical protein